MGIDQHMIAIYKQITKWLNGKRMNEREQIKKVVPPNIVSLVVSSSSDSNCDELNGEIVEEEEEDCDWIDVIYDDMEIVKMADLKHYDDGEDILSDAVYVDGAEDEMNADGCLMM